MILKWVVAAVLFAADGEPINSKLFALDPAVYKTAADCEKVRDEMRKQAADAGASVWTKCLEVDHKPAPLKPQRYTHGG